MAGIMYFVFGLCLLTFCASKTIKFKDSSELFQQNINVQSVLELLISSESIENVKCRNHSKIYIQDVRNFRLWATQMFDATSKFPSGILVGSTYGMGNFDECVETRAYLEDDEFSGKYCLATLTIDGPKEKNPDKFNRNSTDFDFRNDRRNFNVSTWDKILAISRDRSKKLRNEIHWAFCIPSSCSSEFLELHLKELSDVYNQVQDFKISPTVEEKNCQIYKPFSPTAGDVVFMVIMAAIVLTVIIATIYDLLSNMEKSPINKLSGIKHQVLVAFSMSLNMNKILLPSKNQDGLDCINGLKVFSMFLIIMGHRIMFSVGSPLVNANYVESFYSKVEAMVLLNGPIIVDTFFHISGFLACYLLLTKYDKRGNSMNFFALCFHRIVRLTPAYAIVLAFYSTVLIHTGSGPLWQEKIGVEQTRCLSSWWTNLLYINNYVNSDKICMFQSWYITCDMHFFLVTPFIVLLLKKNSKAGVTLLFAIICLSIFSTFAVTYFMKLDAILLLYMRVLKDPIADKTFRNIYIPTHTRASPYFVGALTGYLKYKISKGNFKFPNRWVYISWIFCIFIMEATVYSAYFFYSSKNYDAQASAIYAAFHHFLWSVSISWFILALSTGNGKWIEPILSWKGLVPLSRLTYCAFLCHGGIQLYSVATLRQPAFASIFNLVWYSFGDITFAYLAGLFLCLFFESPVIGLEKIILTKYSSY